MVFYSMEQIEAKGPHKNVETLGNLLIYIYFASKLRNTMLQLQAPCLGSRCIKENPILWVR